MLSESKACRRFAEESLCHIGQPIPARLRALRAELPRRARPEHVVRAGPVGGGAASHVDARPHPQGAVVGRGEAALRRRV